MGRNSNSIFLRISKKWKFTTLPKSTFHLPPPPLKKFRHKFSPTLCSFDLIRHWPQRAFLSIDMCKKRAQKIHLNRLGVQNLTIANETWTRMVNLNQIWTQSVREKSKNPRAKRRRWTAESRVVTSLEDWRLCCRCYKQSGNSGDAFNTDVVVNKGLK